MAKPGYSFVDATFAFAQATGRRPLGVLWIGLWQLLLYAGLTAAILYLAAPLFLAAIELAAEADGADPDPAVLLQFMSGFMGAYLLAVLGFLIAALVVQGAWMRLLARDEIAAVIPLRFGADEFRLLGVNIMFIVLNLIGWTVVVIVFGLINTGVFAAALGGDGEVGVGAALGAGVLNTVLGLVVAVAAIIVMIRFAAAPALSVHQRRFRLFESFAATKGVTGWMLLSYLTIIVIAIFGYIVVSVLQNIIVLAVAADLIPTLSALENTEDPEVVFQVLGQTFMQPSVLIGIAIAIGVQLVWQVFVDGSWHGVGAYVARREGGEFPDDAVITPSGSVGAAPTEG